MAVGCTLSVGRRSQNGNSDVRIWLSPGGPTHEGVRDGCASRRQRPLVKATARELRKNPSHPRHRTALNTDVEFNRRSDRVSLNLPIQVGGTDARGQPFRDKTQTVLVTRHGARIILTRELEPLVEVTIRYPKTGREARARIVEKVGTFQDGNHYGVEVLDAKVNLWGIHFPTAAEVETAVGRVLLECESCHAQEVARLDGFALEVFQANRRISRPCKCSSAMTAWGEVSSEGTPAPSVVSKPAVGPSLTPSAPSLREGPGQSLKVRACVRTAAFGEELVSTEDPAKDGVRFRSERRYQEGEKIEIALPFQPGGGNVFIPAQVKWTSGEPQEGVVTYGVAYLRRVRKAARFEATVEINMGILGVGLRFTGRMVDLSMTGVLMKTSQKLEPGTHVRMGIEMGVHTFRTRAAVRRAVPGVGIAFEFTQMSQRDREHLGRLIQALKIRTKS